MKDTSIPLLVLDVIQSGLGLHCNQGCAIVAIKSGWVQNQIKSKHDGKIHS